MMIENNTLNNIKLKTKEASPQRQPCVVPLTQNVQNRKIYRRKQVRGCCGVGVSRMREHLVVADSLWPHGPQPTRLLCPRGSPGKNTGVGCRFLLQGMLRTRGCSGPGDAPDPGMGPASLASTGGFFTTKPSEKTEQAEGGLYQFARAATTKYQKLISLKTRNLLPYSSGG